MQDSDVRDWTRGIRIVATGLREGALRLSVRELGLLDGLLQQVEGEDVDEPARALGHALRTLVDDLPASDGAAVTELMSVIGGHIFASRRTGRVKTNEHANLYVLEAFFGTSGPPTCHHCGRPEWLGDAWLDALRVEARQRRQGALRRNRAFVARLGPVATAFAASPEVQSMLRGCALEVRGSGFGTFVYYERPGDGVRPHVDVGQFEYNVLLCLEQDPRDGTSSLCLCNRSGVVEVPTHPGDVVVFDAGHRFHGRDPLPPEARVTIASFGFSAAGV